MFWPINLFVAGFLFGMLLSTIVVGRGVRLSAPYVSYRRAVLVFSAFAVAFNVLVGLLTK